MSETKKNIIETVRFVVTVFALWLIIRIFLVQPFLVDGASMSPNFETNDYLIVDKLSYFFREPTRGDVIVFKYPSDTSKYFIKRIIGLPGETVTVRDGNTTVKTVAGRDVHINETFVQNTSDNDAKVLTLGAGEYFVMGDNRNQSFDSRAWGPLDKKYIGGRALVRLYPFNKIDILPAGIKKFNLTSLEE
jgi:signal peptidase I